MAGRASRDRAVAHDRRRAARHLRSDLRGREGDRRHPVQQKRLSRPAAFAGAASLAALYSLCVWGALALGGFSATAWLGVQIGAFFGLGSLAIELAVLERTYRTCEGSGTQAVLGTFIARVFTVGLLMTTFQVVDAPVQQEAFALAYVSTFLVYMCWLTWKTATAPIQYQPKPKRRRKTARAVKVLRSGESVR